MPDSDLTDDLLLPPRTRLLHVGPMKTGTTSIQAAARARRDLLLANGVRYPGGDFNHKRGLGALMGWSVNTGNRSGPLQPDLLDIDKSGVPPQRDWDALKSEIEEEHERRIFLSHEFVSQVDDATARRMVDAIGEPVHICLTLRSPGQIVPSLWAQSVRDDVQTEPFDAWLARFYGSNSDNPIPTRFRRAYDQGALVRRWADAVGTDNVTVILVDKSQPGMLTGAFEAMLGLPPGTLKWGRSARSLTATDAELFRHVNILLRDRGASWATFQNLVRYGAIKRGPEKRPLAPGEASVALPPWAAAIADRDGPRFAEAIQNSGARIIGDLNALTSVTTPADWPVGDTVPIEIAAESIYGAIMAGQDIQDRLRARLKSKDEKPQNSNATQETIDEVVTRSTIEHQRLAARLETLATERDRLNRDCIQLVAERDRLNEKCQRMEVENNRIAAKAQKLASRLNKANRQPLRLAARRIPATRRAHELASAFGIRDLARATLIRVIGKAKSSIAGPTQGHQEPM